MPVRLDPATADAQQWNRYHELRRLRHAELFPDHPLRPDEIVEANMKKRDPIDFHHFFEVSRGGAAISTFHCEAVRPENPEYATNKHLLWVDAYVRPEERRRGVGMRWLNVVVQMLDEHDARVFGMSADNEAAHAFLKWLGATPKLTDIESRLNLSEVDWAMVARWVEEGRERSPQTRLEIYDGSLPREMWDDFAAQRSLLLNTIPFEGLEMGDIVITPEKIGDWIERAKVTHTVWHNILTREPDGTISGMTDVEWTSYGRKQIQQQFTGVLPAARGRGIGKWIKAAMLLHMRELYPDAESVVTDNAHSNAPMLKINRDLGFKPSRTSVDYQMSRADLEAKIASL